MHIIADTLSNSFSFQLRENRNDVHHSASHRCAGIELLTDGDEGYIQGIVGVLIAVAVLPFSAIGLFLVGLGNGSIYPNLIHLTPINFGESVSQSIMGSQIATAYLGVMLAPPLFGLVSNLFGIQVFPLFLMVLFVIMTAFIGIFVRQLKASGRYDKTA